MERFYLNRHNDEVKVGIITLIALLSLVLGYSWLKNYFSLREYTELRIAFPNASGIEQGDAVTILGVEKGRVRSLDVEGNHVVIHALVKLAQPLPQDTRFMIRESDLMGKRQLEIRPGSASDRLDTRSTLQGEGSSGMTDLVVQLNATIQVIDQLMHRMSKEGGVFSNLESTVANSEQMTANANKLITENAENVTRVLSHLEDTSRELSTLLSDNRQSIQETVTLAPQVMDKLNRNLGSLDHVSTNLVQISNKWAQDGSLQKLMSEREFYDSLLHTTRQLDSLLQDVKSHPTRYFKIKVF